MTKKEICDTVRNIVGYHIDRRQVASVITHLYNTYIHNSINPQLKRFEYLTKEYTNQSVSLDPSEDVFYIDLPASVVALPTKTDGVIAINNVDGQDWNYFPMTAMDVRYSQGLDSDVINTYTGYYVEGKRIKLYNHNGSITKVRMLLAIEFNDFEWDDEVTLPSGGDVNILDAVVSIFLNRPLHNLKNDNAKA